MAANQDDALPATQVSRGSDAGGSDAGGSVGRRNSSGGFRGMSSRSLVGGAASVQAIGARPRRAGRFGACLRRACSSSQGGGCGRGFYDGLPDVLGARLLPAVIDPAWRGILPPRPSPRRSVNGFRVPVAVGSSLPASHSRATTHLLARTLPGAAMVAAVAGWAARDQGFLGPQYHGTSEGEECVRVWHLCCSVCWWYWDVVWSC